LYSIHNPQILRLNMYISQNFFSASENTYSTHFGE
jgi:hypothetical protein